MGVAALIGLGVFLAAFAARMYLLSNYGSSLPYWDQWFAEPELIYKPFVEHRLDWSTLWGAHNEHRILLPRLFFLFLFYVNQLQWDPMVQAIGGAILISAFYGVFAAWISRNSNNEAGAVLSLGIAVIGVMPNGWENTVAGFQVCFYLVIIFSAGAIAVAAKISGKLSGLVLVFILCSCAFFSLASGALVALVCSGILLARSRLGSISLRRGLWAMSLLAGLFLIFVAYVPHVVGHDIYRPSSFSAYLTSLISIMRWPFNFLNAGLVQWVPLAVWVWRSMVRREASSDSLIFAGISIWTFLNCMSIAYSRGVGGEVASRYTDILALGSFANIYLACQLISRTRVFGVNFPVRAVAIGALAITSAALYVDWQGRSSLAQERSAILEIAKSSVRDFVISDRATLQGKRVPVPASLAGELERILSDKTVLSLLPYPLVAPLSGSFQNNRRYCKWVDYLAGKAIGDNLSCGDRNISSVSVAEVWRSVGPLSAAAQWLRYVFPKSWKARVQAASVVRSGDKQVLCALDTINDEALSDSPYRLSYSPALKIAGWVGPRVLASSISVIFQGNEAGVKYLANIDSSIVRHDVESVFKDRNMKGAGYSLWIDGSAIPPGEYTVLLAIDGGSICRTNRRVINERVPDSASSY